MVMPARTERQEHREAGFTLSELLVVMALIGVVIGVAYMFIYAAQLSSDRSNREAEIARSVTLPIQNIGRLLMQNSGIAPSPVTGTGQSPAPTPPGPYTMTFLTDQNSDNVLERHTITAVRDSTTNQGYVVKSTYLVNAAGSPVGSAVTQAKIALNNANVRDSVPLFLYYDKDKNLIDPAGGGVSTLAAYVVIQMRVTLDGVSETHTDTVVFRNR